MQYFLQIYIFFLIIAKKVNQIKNNKACIVARLGFVFCYTLTTGRYNDFQDVFVNQKKSEFYSPQFQNILFFVTMIQKRRMILDYFEFKKVKSRT